MDKDSKIKLLMVEKVGFIDQMKDFWIYCWIVVVGLFFGVFCGMIFGVGEFMLQFMFYFYVQCILKMFEMFGKGNFEGIVVLEVVNNLVFVVVMILFLVFGILGEELMVMMLVVFYVYNVIFGFQFFLGQMDFVLVFYFCLLLLNIIVVVFLFFVIGMLMKVMIILNCFFGMMILIFSFIGVYSLCNLLMDVVIVSGFGVFGFMFKWLDYLMLLIIFGIVLGKLMEDKLCIVMVCVCEFWDFIDCFIVFILFCMIVIVLLLQVWIVWKGYRVVKINIINVCEVKDV